MPQVMLMLKRSVMQAPNDWKFYLPSFVKRHAQSARINKLVDPDAGILWELDHYLKVKIISASYINLVDLDEVNQILLWI